MERIKIIFAAFLVFAISSSLSAQADVREVFMCNYLDGKDMEDVIKISDEHKLEVVTESFPLEQANEVLVKLKNSEIDARAVLIP